MHRSAVRALLLLAARLPAAAYAGSCNVGSKRSCDADDLTATSEVFFFVNRTDSNEGLETYDATVIFHWGVENVTLGRRSYRIGDPIGLSNTYQYDEAGYYEVGYTLIFEDDAAAGCSGDTFGSTSVLKMERAPDRCDWDVEEPPASLPAPTPSPVAVPPAVPSCHVSYRYACNPVNLTAESIVYFAVNPVESNEGFETFDATVIFHWGAESVTVDRTQYLIGQPLGLRNAYQYDAEGYYDVGYTLIFGDEAAGGCSGKTYGKTSTLKMDLDECAWDAELPSPTPSPIFAVADPAPAVPAVNTGPGGSNGNGGTPPKPESHGSPNDPSSTCSVHYDYSCDPDTSVASFDVYFIVHAAESNEEFDTYQAKGIFHWGEEDKTTGSQQYRIGDPVGLSSTYQYGKAGSYDIGYTLVFEDDTAASCSGRTFSERITMQMDPMNECSFDDEEAATETPTPALSPLEANGDPGPDGSTCNLCGPDQIRLNNPVILNGEMNDCAGVYTFMAKNHEQGSADCVSVQQTLSSTCCSDHGVEPGQIDSPGFSPDLPTTPVEGTPVGSQPSPAVGEDILDVPTTTASGTSAGSQPLPPVPSVDEDTNSAGVEDNETVNSPMPSSTPVASKDSNDASSMSCHLGQCLLMLALIWVR